MYITIVYVDKELYLLFSFFKSDINDTDNLGWEMIILFTTININIIIYINILININIFRGFKHNFKTQTLKINCSVSNKFK
jgi:hypothetical protein